MPARTWLRKLKADSWTQRLSGRTAELSHSNNLADWWTSSLLAIRAKDSVLPASVKVKKILASYGLGLCGQLQLFNLATVSSRTSMDTSRLDSPQSSVIWKQRVIELRKEYSARLKSAQATEGNGYSSWPSPNTMPEAPNSGLNRGNGQMRARTTDQCLGRVAQTWPTPRSEDSESCGNHPGATDSLTGATKHWPTPRANDPEKRGEFDATDPRTGLPGAASTWRTPTDDSNRGGAQSGAQRLAAGHAMNLQDQVQSWPTPTSRDHKDGTAASCENVPVNGLLGRAVHNFPNFLPDQQTSKGGVESLKSTRRLNPRFVAWLMGVHPEWMNCDWPATVLSGKPPQKHSQLCLEN